ncbi:hypothetical protein DFS33DRAFT_1263971, partial [Desarmillaria ectypa]
SHVLFNVVRSPMNYVLDRPKDGSLEVVWMGSVSNAPGQGAAKRMAFQMEDMMRLAHVWPETKYMALAVLE